MSKVMLPGSYDPITVGHLDIIRRCSKLYDDVTVLISKNPSKNYLLSSEKRSILAQDAVKDLPNVSVDIFDGLLVEYAISYNIDAVVKGLRNADDYNYEQNMAETNLVLSRRLYNYDFETMYMPCKKEYCDISSSLVRLLLSKNGDVSGLVPNKELLISML